MTDVSEAPPPKEGGLYGMMRQIADSGAFRPPTGPPMELVVVASEREAAHAGFNTATLVHRKDPSIRVWWPNVGEQRLRGLSVRRVTLAPSARYEITIEMSRALQEVIRRWGDEGFVMDLT